MQFDRLKNRRRQRGSVAVVVLLVMVAVTAITLAVASISLAAVRSARLAQDRITGLALAEAGIDATMDALKSDHETETLTGTLYIDAANQKPLGTYSVTIATLDEGRGIKRAVSTGRNINGTTTRVIARVLQEKRALGSAAQMADGPITVGGNASILTTPANEHIADVYANGNVSLGGSGTVDGTLISAGSVIGTAYYESVSNAPRLIFPDMSVILGVVGDLRELATAAGSTYYTGGSLGGGGNTVRTITAPAFIDGDLSLTGNRHLIIQGSGVVYINGNLRMNGGIITNSSTLIVNGSFTQNGQAIYGIGATPVGGATPSFAVATGEIQLNGGATNQLWGIIYAMNGPIRVNGDAVFTGAMVSMGTGANISSTGNFTQFFPTNMASLITVPDDPKVTQILEF